MPIDEHPVGAPGAVTPGTVTETTIDPTTGGINVNVAAEKSAPPTVIANLTYPNAGLFQGQGVWMLGPTITLPLGARRVSFNCVYTGTGPTSQVEFRVRQGHASNKMGVEPVDDITLSVSGTVASENEYDRVRVRPTSGAVAMTWGFDLDVSAWPLVALDFAELVQDGAGAGTMTSVTWEASFA